MKKNSAKRAALILSASIVGACIASYLILAIVLLSLGMHDVLSYISVFFCFACAISSAVFGYLTYRRHKVGRRMRQSLIGQLDDLSKGIVSYGEPLTGYDDLDRFQDEFNYSLSSLRAVEKAEDAPHYKGLGFIEEETSFPSTLLEEIRRNPSYRQALLAIKATGKGKIDDIGFQKLRVEILSAFPDALLSPYGDDGYFAYVYDCSSFVELYKRCATLVANFAHQGKDQSQGEGNVFGARVGGAIFPFIPAVMLIDSAKKALDKGKDVEIDKGDGKIYYPSNKSNRLARQVIALTNFEKLFSATYTAKDEKQRRQTLRDSLSYFLKTEGFSRGGFLRYDHLKQGYELLFEVAEGEDEVCSPKALGDFMPERFIDPLYDRAKEDFPLLVNSLPYADKAVADFLDSLRAGSAVLAPVEWSGEKFGLLYMLSKDPGKAFGLDEASKLHDLYSLFATAIISSKRLQKDEEKKSLLDALSRRAGKYIYAIDEDYLISECTSNLQKKLGFDPRKMKCHKALFDSDSPCPMCPLRQGAISATIKKISAKPSLVSVVTRGKSGSSSGSVLIIEPTGKASDSPLSKSSLDKNLLIPNLASFKSTLSRELVDGDGFILAFRLINAQKVLSSHPLQTYSTLLYAILENLESTPYISECYRYDDHTIAIKLSSMYKRTELYAAVEEIALSLNAAIDVEGEQFSPRYSYCAIYYPAEVGSVEEMVSLIRTELTRSQKLGEGLLAEVGRNNLRKASRKDNFLSLAATMAARDKAKFAFSPIYEASTKRIAAFEAFPILEENGKPISSGEFVSIFQSDQKALVAYGQSAMRGTLSFLTGIRNELRKASVSRIYFRIRSELVSSDALYDFLTATLPSYPEVKDKVGILVDAGTTIESPTAKSGMERLAKLGVKIALSDVREEHLGSDFDFSSADLVEVTEGLCRDAMDNDSTSLALLRFASRMQQEKVQVACKGVSDERTLGFLSGSMIGLAKGGMFGSKVLLPEGVVSALNYSSN